MKHASTSQTAPPTILPAAGPWLDSHVADAARVIKAGGLVAFPTETVYGIGVSAHVPGALDKLFALKGRDPSKPVALLLSRFDEAERFVPGVPALARRLAAAYCPGPITLVLPGRDGSTVGLRVPDHPIALALVRACGGALYATSANVSGHRPARSAAEVAAAFPEGLDLVLDGGAAQIGEPSTVVKVTDDRYEILRVGAIPAEQIGAAARQ